MIALLFNSCRFKIDRSVGRSCLACGRSGRFPRGVNPIYTLATCQADGLTFGSTLLPPTGLVNPSCRQNRPFTSIRTYSRKTRPVGRKMLVVSRCSLLQLSRIFAMVEETGSDLSITSRHDGCVDFDRNVDEMRRGAR